MVYAYLVGISLLSISNAQATMNELNRLAGGKWVAVKGPVTQRFESLSNGKVLVGETTVKTPNGEMKLNARFGYDPEKDKVYYIDFHESQTVYFGHVTLQDKKLVYNRSAPFTEHPLEFLGYVAPHS